MTGAAYNLEYKIAMDQDTAVAPPKTEQTASVPQKQDYQETDIFAWSNNLMQHKGDIKFDLFFFTKTGVPYRAKLNANLSRELEPLFIDGILDYVLNGANEGLVVRGFEEAEGEENVLQRTRAKNVEKLAEVMHWLWTMEGQIEQFNEEDHDLKRIKGMVIKGSHPGLEKPFYVVKQLPKAQVLKGVGAWVTEGGTFGPLPPATGLRIPVDNQLLVLDQDLYVFSQGKLDTLFGYNAKKNSIAEKKVRAIEANFRLSFAEGLDMQAAVRGSKALINKLQKIEPTLVKQDQLMDHADELGIDLMQDEDGAIIIMDNKDLAKFVNLLNDDYVESQLTGMRYEIKSKKPLKLAESDEG